MSDPISARAGRSPGSGFGPARSFQSLLGVSLLSFGAWLLLDFPVGRPGLLALATVLAVVQWRDSRAWLVVVPVLFAVIDLGAWSGRFLFSEQDALLAVLAGIALVAGQYRGSGAQLVQPVFIPLWLLAVMLTVGVVRGLAPLPELDANAWSGYLTGWNAVRVAKGPAWALVLWPLLARQLAEDRALTETRMASGMAAALIGLGALVLWERGLPLDVMQAKDVWGLFSTWLDLAGSYRITGPFSQMHLGGEAVDGFLALSWPFAFLLLFQGRRWPLIVLGLLALALASYAVMVTFTRMTYAAIVVAFLAFGAAALLGAAPGRRGRLAWSAIYATLAAAVFLYGFRLGGSLAMAGYLAIMLGAMGAGMFVVRKPARARFAIGLLLVLGMGTIVALHGMINSKWNAIEPRTAVAVVAASALLLGGGGLALGASLRSWARTRAAATVPLALAVLLPLLTLSLSGYRMSERFSAVGSDLESRRGHWREVLDLMPSNATTAAFGLGLGRFPLVNLIAGDEPTGTWHFERDGQGHFLRLLGTASLCYGQRVQGLKPGIYRVEVGLRNPSKLQARLAVKLQPRRLLESESWQPQTEQINFDVAPDGGAWRHLSGQLHLHASSAPPWYDPRFAVLALTNQGDSRSAVDVAYIRLVDPDGRDRLVNGDFAAGGDRWFAYNDFSHLEWHTKNFYIALYFDMGLLGLLAFGAACLVALLRGWQQARQGSLFGAAAASALVGFMLLGATGTLLDVPQLMTLLILVAVAVSWPARAR